MRLHSRTLLAALLASLPALSAAAQNSDPPAVKPRDLAKYDAQIKAAMNAVRMGSPTGGQVPANGVRGGETPPCPIGGAMSAKP